MNEMASGGSVVAAAARAPRLRDWIVEGLRAGLFLRPRIAGAGPRPLHLLAVLLIASIIDIALGRLEVPGDAGFNLRAWLASWCGLGAAALLVWSLLADARSRNDGPQGTAAWIALWTIASLPAGFVAEALTISQAWEALPEWLADLPFAGWASYLLLWTWSIAVAVRLGASCGLAGRRLVALGGGVTVIFGIAAWQFPDRPWEAPAPAVDESPRLSLTQEAFEAQQVLWQQTVDALAPQRPGVVDVYGLVFAPYATEDVFLRESNLVSDVLAQRFDAEGRVLQLVNHPTTSAALPWATPLNLKRAIDAIGQKMDREQDVLVVYLTSHGASNFQLAAVNPPLEVDTVSPSELRRALDDAGIRNRVIAISACFSGGWVAPLASDSTLVMTAADADHTSYGCGRLSELTFFGRAMFDEQLRQTHSFERAFAAAVPVIQQREIEGRKPDGFSNPQISVGARIKPVLDALAARLDAAPRP